MLSWLFTIAFAGVALVCLLSMHRMERKLGVTIKALRRVATGHPLFPDAVARMALRDVGELDGGPEA